MEKYRIGATFERTRANILAFLQKKLQRKSQIYVVLQMVLLKDNMSRDRCLSETLEHSRRGRDPIQEG